jgi:rhodanese-related sulfurtransferase
VNLRRHLLEAATLVLLAVVCALVANGLASRERKLALVGSYPNALRVLPRGVEVSAPSSLASAAPPEGQTSLPFKEKRLGPTPPSAPKASGSPAASETRSFSSSSDLEKRFPPHPDKPYVEISGDDVAWLAARGVLVLDARRTKVYEEGHVAGARNVSVWESDVDAKVTALVNEGRDGAIPVVVYCSGGDCEDSHMLAEKLFGAGFNNLLVYHDGWPDWQKRGGRSATGPES